MLSEKKQLERIIIYVGAVTISLLFYNIYEYIQRDSYYLIYPKHSVTTTYILLAISIVLTIILSWKYLNFRKVKKLTTRFTIYSIALILSSSITIGCLKYLVYLKDKTSYLVDENVLSKQLENEEEQFRNLIIQYRTHKTVCNTLLNELEQRKTIKATRQTKDLFLGLIKDRETDFYLSKINDISLLLKKIPYRMESEEDLPTRRDIENNTPPTPLNELYTYSIVISNINSTFDIEGALKIKPQFISLYEKPTLLSSSVIKKILESHIEVLDMNIILLNENINIIKTRGLPLSYFTMDSMMKSFNSSPGYYKPTNLWTMFLSLLHILIIVYFIIPLIGIGIELLKFNKCKSNL